MLHRSLSALASTIYAASIVCPLTLAIGCASPAADAADATAASHVEASSGLSARVETVPLVATVGQCSIATNYIKIHLADPAAAAAINTVLAQSIADYASEEDCADSSFDLEGESTVAFNERGVLTVTRSESSYSDGAAHPIHSYGVLNFDLRNGTILDLPQLIDAAGRRIIADTCARVLGDGETDDVFAEFCNAEVDKTRPVYSVERDGLRIHPVSLPHAGFPTAVAGALVPWAMLSGHITNDLVLAIAK